MSASTVFNGLAKISSLRLFTCLSRCLYNVTGELQRPITEDSFLFFRESDDLERLQWLIGPPVPSNVTPPSTKVSKMGIKSPLRLHRHKRASGGSFANSCNSNFNIVVFRTRQKVRPANASTASPTGLRRLLARPLNSPGAESWRDRPFKPVIRSDSNSSGSLLPQTIRLTMA